LWPLFLLDLLACLTVAGGTSLVFLASHWRWSALKSEKLTLLYLALTVVHCMFALDWVLRDSPKV
jgi:hypothetical protein